MKPPVAYAEWLALLDRFRRGDDRVLEPMRLGQLEWTSVVAERWTRQIAAALSERVDSLAAGLQNALDRTGGDRFEVASALLAARRGIEPLRALAALPAAPADVRKHLAAELDRWIAEVQSALERGAAAHADQGSLLKTVRDTSLEPAKRGGSFAQPAETRDEPSANGRRIIIGEVPDA